MLFVLVQQIVENLLVEDRDAFEVVAGARLERHDLVDESVRLVTQVRDVLLALHLLLDVR